MKKSASGIVGTGILLMVYSGLCLTGCFASKTNKSDEVSAISESSENDEETVSVSSEEDKIEEEKIVLPPFGEWTYVPREELDMETEAKYNGVLLEEYTRGNIRTEIRGHNQKIIEFWETADVFTERPGDETVSWIYDNPDDKNHIGDLEIDKPFYTKKLRKDYDLTSGEISYWLEIYTETVSGWIFMIKSSRPLRNLYENEEMVENAARFVYELGEKIVHIREIYGSLVTVSTGLIVYDHPFFDCPRVEFISADNKKWGGTEIEICGITAEADKETVTDGQTWYYIKTDSVKGWISTETPISYEKGLLYSSPELVIDEYYYMGV